MNLWSTLLMHALKTLWRQLLPNICLLMAALATAETLPVLDIWSGREQAIAVPAGATWALITEHGRELGHGVSQGAAIIHLSALLPGAQESAFLVIKGQKQAAVRIWSPEILAGKTARFEHPNGKLAEKLLQHGLKHHDRSEVLIGTTCSGEASESSAMIFPEKWDFPIALKETWPEISLHHTKKGGCLSVLFNKSEQIIDRDGTLTYVICKTMKAKLYLFSPDFDFQAIENVLLLKTALEEKKP